MLTLDLSHEPRWLELLPGLRLKLLPAIEAAMVRAANAGIAGERHG